MYRSGAVMAWNVFKFCTALRGLGSIMILLVLGVVGVTYYAVVISNYGPALVEGGVGFLTALAVLILFHILLVMLLWSYFTVVFTDPGSVPPNWRPALDEERGDTDPLTAPEFNGMPGDPSNPRIRYCRKCNQLKPPRCHHCSVCGRCVLKMDHHCVWVVNCVGALNYKYFLLFLAQVLATICTFDLVSFLSKSTPPSKYVVDPDDGGSGAKKLNVKYMNWLHSDQLLLGWLFSMIGRGVLALVIHSESSAEFYTFLETTLVTLSLLPHFIAFFSDEEIPGTPGMLATTFLAFVLNLAFALSVMGFLIMHISLVAANTTTIEAYEKKTTPKWRYDLGRKRNFEQVFGMDKRYWFIPAYSEEDLRRMPALQGLQYPSKPDLDAQEF